MLEKKYKLEFFWINIGLIVWMGTSVFRTLIYLPVVGYKIQLFEIFFGFFFLYMSSCLRANLKETFLFKKSLLFFVVILLMNLFFHISREIIFDILALIYACFIPIVFAFSLNSIEHPEKVIKKGIMTISIILVCTTFFGYLIHYFDISNLYVYEYPNYPYLGDVNRIIGFMNGPNQVAFIGIICIIYFIFVNEGASKKIRITLIILLSVMLLFTYSKELILLPFSLIIVYFSLIKRWKIFSLILCIFFILSILVLTFFYFSKESDFRKDVIGKEIFVQLEDIKVYPTAYYFLWKSSLKMIKENPISGVGVGNFDKEISNHQKQKTYPDNLWIYNAHDNYTGLIAQLGIGFLLVLFSFINDFSKVSMILEKDVAYFVASAAYFILLYGFISFSQNLRFMWLFFGIVLFYSLRSKQDSK